MPPRRTRNKGFPSALIWTAAAAAVGVVFLLGLAERRIDPLFSGGAAGEYTTRVFSAPRRLRAGDPLSAEELRFRLKRLRYSPAPPGSGGPGTYDEAGGAFEVHPRDFPHPFVHASPVRVRIRIEGGRVASLQLASTGRELAEAALEPELIFEISGAKRIRRDRLLDSDVPERMAQAVVAVEDRRFFEHHGIDPRGLARAAWRDLRALRLAEGGSTLTQQLARSLFLDPRRTLRRKAAEAGCALYLELRFSKRELLRLYLESVYFGQNGPLSIVGLPAAARHFFNKGPRELSLGECALLAGLLRSPYFYNPFRSPEEALRRRRVVLEAMRSQGFIDAQEAAAAAREPLRVTRSGQGEILPADYFIAYLQRHLAARYEDEALLTKGLTIHTTEDPWLQELAGRTVRKAAHQAALVALDPRSGAIRALVGGKDFLSSPFDRATLARRQPGSAFKPFVYGAALRAPSAAGKGWTPASLLPDTTRQYAIEGGTWQPRNYDRRYHGDVPLRTALAQSLNSATVALADSIGPQRVIDYARSLGIASPLRRELGLALGASEVNLLELAGAYCAFANGGFRVEPYAVEAALDSNGDMLEYRGWGPRRAIEPGEAFLMTELLREVARSGTGKGLERWGLQGLAAGKTGTTDEGKDAWFIGFTPALTAGVWTGSDLPAPLELTGAGAALPLWADFMKQAAPFPAQGFGPPPPGVSLVEIDPETGSRARLGCPKKASEYFLAGTEPAIYCERHSGGIAGWLRNLLQRHPRKKP